MFRFYDSHRGKNFFSKNLFKFITRLHFLNLIFTNNSNEDLITVSIKVS